MPACPTGCWRQFGDNGVCYKFPKMRTDKYGYIRHKASTISVGLVGFSKINGNTEARATGAAVVNLKTALTENTMKIFFISSCRSEWSGNENGL